MTKFFSTSLKGPSKSTESVRVERILMNFWSGEYDFQASNILPGVGFLKEKIVRYLVILRGEKVLLVTHPDLIKDPKSCFINLHILSSLCVRRLRAICCSKLGPMRNGKSEE